MSTNQQKHKVGFEADPPYSAVDLRLVFIWLVTRVSQNLVPVEYGYDAPSGGHCRPDAVVLNPNKLWEPFSIFVLLHEAAHWMLHMGVHEAPPYPDGPFNDSRAMIEFEANQVATALFARLGLGMCTRNDRRCSAEQASQFWAVEEHRNRIAWATDYIWQKIRK